MWIPPLICSYVFYVLKMFHDLDPNFVVDDEMVHLDKLLGKGAFGKVFAGELRRVCILLIWQDLGKHNFPLSRK